MVKLHRREFVTQMFAASCGLAAVSGCANWQDETGGASNLLKQPRLASNAVTIELAFVRMTESLAQPIRKLWSSADEQHVSIELRRILYANGIRTGSIGTGLPSVLRDALEDQSVTATEVAQNPAMLENPTVRRYRMQCKAGKIVPVAVSPDSRDRTILLRENDVVRGQTFPNCQCKLELEASPQTNGLAAVRITPLVEFGEAKNRPKGRDGIWQVGLRKEERRFSDLSMQMELRPGETVLLTCTEPAQGIGSAFFTDGDGTAMDHRLVLVRLAQAQGDGVFHANGRSDV
jgi:hypothetical protein